MLLNQAKMFGENILSFIKVVKLLTLKLNPLVDFVYLIKNNLFNVLLIPQKLNILKQHVDYMNNRLNKLEQAIEENNKYTIIKGSTFNIVR